MNDLTRLLIQVAASDAGDSIAEKSVPRRQREAELRLKGELRNLLSGAVEEALDARLAGYRGPAVERPFYAVYDRAVAAAAKEAENASVSGWNRIVNAVQNEGKSVFYGDVPGEVLRRARNTVPSTVGPAILRITERVKTAEPEELAGVVNRLFSSDLERIVRTEMNDFQNAGAFAAELSLGVEYHQWVSRQDAWVRKTHKKHTGVHGEIVRVGERFSNGLLFPGDRKGPLREWISCRCKLVPVFNYIP